MSELMKQAEFFAALEAARQPRHGGGHPFSRAWADGELSREQLGEWAIQHFYYIDAVPQQFAALYARLPDLDARQHLLENLLGEEMPASPGLRRAAGDAAFRRGQRQGTADHPRNALMGVGARDRTHAGRSLRRNHGRAGGAAADPVSEVRQSHAKDGFF
jgi:hypothetical protein